MKSWLNLLSPGHHHFSEALGIRGWALSKLGKVEQITVMLYSGKRRVLCSILDLLPSLDVQKKFPSFAGAEQARFSITLDAQQIAEFGQGQDVALEFIALVQGKQYSFNTVVFLADSSDKKIIFIVGSPRSGTSILGNALRQVLNADSSFSEGHVLAILPELEASVRNYYASTPASKLEGFMLSHMNQNLLVHQLHQTIKRQYEQLLDSQWIVDKTPGIPMLQALPSIQMMWPQAHFIFAKRRGIENINSRLQKFPQESFENHARQWQSSMMLWRQFRKQLPRKLEIDQYDIQRTPAQVAEQLSRYLGLDSQQEERLSQQFSSDRPEQLVTTSNDKPLVLDDTHWSAEQKHLFLDICHEAMSAYGYSLGSSYYLG